MNVIGAANGDGRIADQAAKPIVTIAITAAAALVILHTRSREPGATVAATAAKPESPAASSISRCATAMSGSRRRSSFSRQRRSKRWMLSGVVAGKSAQSGSRSRIAAMWSETVSPGNAIWPVSISYKTQPNAQTSARLSTALPRACSGDMYAAVPRIIPACVIAGDVIVGELARCA